MNYCELSETTEFQYTVDHLRDAFGTDAERIAYKSYLENGGQFLTPDEIIASERNEFFSPVAPDIEVNQAINRENSVSQKKIFDELGVSVPKKYLSQQQINNLKGVISKTNNRLYKEGIEKHYELKDVEQIGESDNFKWRVAELPGKINIDLKAEKAREISYEKNKLPSKQSQYAMDLSDYNFNAYLREVNPQTLLMRKVNDELYSDEYFSKFDNNRNISQEILQKFTKGLSERLGIDYNIVTPSEAYNATKDSANPWQGEKAFYSGSTVYLLGDNYNLDDVFHEFSHPVVRALSKSNEKLFNNLYDKLVATGEGAKLVEQVKELYGELSPDSSLFKEEVLVRALTKSAELSDEDLKQPVGFKKFIADLLFNIRQMLRQVFGSKIKISALKANTTIRELALMIKGDRFQLDREEVTQEDIVAYKKEYTSQLKDLLAKGLDVKEIEDLTNKYFDLVSKQMSRLIKDEKYPELLELAKNKYKAGELEKIKQNLKPYQSKILQDAIEIQDEAELTRERALAVVSSMNNLSNLMVKISDSLENIIKTSSDDPDSVRKVLYYQNSINYWSDFVNTASDALEKEGVRIPAIDKINTLIKRSNASVNKFYQEASGDILWSTLESAAEKINAKWEGRIAELEKKKAPANVIENERKKYAAEKISKESIKKALKGDVKDLSFAGYWLESYSYSPNPVVGGTSLFIKNAVTDIEAVAQKKVNEQADILSPLLKQAGYNPNMAHKLGEDLGQKEEVGSINNETGEFEKREVWRFLNQFKGADLAQDEYRFKIRELSDKFQNSGSEEDKQALANMQAEYDQFLQDYFNQEYVPAFYKMYEPFKRDDVGRAAKMQLDDIYAQINRLQNDVVSAEDEITISEQIESLIRQRKQLSSLVDEFGNQKTGQDLEIAIRIKEFNEKSKDFYTTEEIPGAFQDALQSYEQKLIDEGKTPESATYFNLRSQWIEKNTRTVISEDFWNTLNDVNERIKSILEDLPTDTVHKLQVEDAYKEIRDLLTGTKDESGQPVGSEMTEESLTKIRKAQERITKAQEFLNSSSGLTRIEKQEMESIFSKIDAGQAKPADYVNLNRLLDKQEILGLDKLKRAALRGLYAKLEELRQREPTDAYVDTVNAYLKGMITNPLFERIGSNEIDKTNAFVILNEEVLDDLFTQSPEFEKWFKNNHFKKPSLDQTTGLPTEKWEKTFAWNVIRPKDPKYLMTTKLYDEAGNVTEEITGLPSMKYYKRLVKEEFKTKKVVGETVDNRGNWLPKTVPQGAKDSRFINADYSRMKIQNPAKFALLEKMKEIHLKNQQDGHVRSKLWYDFPRYKKPTLERLGSENPTKRILESVRNFWTDVKDKWDQGFNYQDDLQLTRLDLFDDETTGVPISGLSNLDIGEVSTDITYGMMRYMLSMERQKKLIEIAPTVKAIQNVVNNPENFPFAKQAMGTNSIININKKKDKFLQAEAINNIVEKTFEGKSNLGWGSDNAVAQNFSNFLFKQAGFSYLALNIPSALKNSIGAKFQGLIESVAGKYFSVSEFIKAEGLASSVTFQISGEIYKKGSKSLNVQLVELFDPERDKFQYQIGESLSRSPLKDTAKPFERLNDFRKFTQLQASLQTFFAMMDHTKVQKDGKDISYKDAWEVKDGKIQLKAGIDPEWGITYDAEGNQKIGEKFKNKRNEIHRVMENLNGAMSTETRAEAERYLLGRYLLFFRRFFVSMFVNRFGHSGNLFKGSARGRLDSVLGDTKQGWYITNLQLLAKMIRTGGRYLPYASKEEKTAFFRLTTEVGTLLLISSLMPVLFDYDPEDKDRFKKLRAKSGNLPLPFVPEDPNHPFQLGGWLSNHALLLAYQVRGENETFLPFPGLGLNSYKDYLDLKSLATGPTLKNYITIAEDLYYWGTNDDRGIFKKDSGPYEWSKADERKIWSHIAKGVGLTGSTVDPVRAFKNFENIRNR